MTIFDVATFPLILLTSPLFWLGLGLITVSSVYRSKHRAARKLAKRDLRRAEQVALIRDALEDALEKENRL